MQCLHSQLILNEQHMVADGVVSHGHLEEIMRCDVGWTSVSVNILSAPLIEEQYILFGVSK